MTEDEYLAQWLDLQDYWRSHDHYAIDVCSAGEFCPGELKFTDYLELIGFPVRFPGENEEVQISGLTSESPNFRSQIEESKIPVGESSPHRYTYPSVLEDADAPLSAGSIEVTQEDVRKLNARLDAIEDRLWDMHRFLVAIGEAVYAKTNEIVDPEPIQTRNAGIRRQPPGRGLIP